MKKLPLKALGLGTSAVIMIALVIGVLTRVLPSDPDRRADLCYFTLMSGMNAKLMPLMLASNDAQTNLKREAITEMYSAPLQKAQAVMHSKNMIEYNGETFATAEFANIQQFPDTQKAVARALKRSDPQSEKFQGILEACVAAYQ